MRRPLLLLACLAAIALAPAAVHAQLPQLDNLEFKWSGMIGADVRYRYADVEIPPAGQTVPYPSQRRLLKRGFERVETLFRPQLQVKISDRVKAVADVEFVWYSYSDAPDIDALTLHERVDPYRLEMHAAYLDLYKLLPGLDVRIGRQVVHWGAADRFNPTNNLNSLDFSDPLLFGRPLANTMVRLDWNPKGDTIFTGVFVPIFRPAQLPRTAPYALTQVERPLAVQEEQIRTQLGKLAALFPPDKVNVITLQPEPSLSNTQFGVRMATRVLGQDLSLSYYRGRFGIPVPAAVQNKSDKTVTVALTWPPMQVIGFDINGSVEKLGGMGYWVEAGVFFPQEITVDFLVQGLTPVPQPLTWARDKNGDFTQTLGVLGGIRPTIVPTTPFVKLTAGVDYSWNRYLYSNVQYVYGFIDEFGAGQTAFPREGAKPDTPPRVESRLGHYLVAGTDLKLFSDVLLLRFFGVFRMPAPGELEHKFTAVLFPQVAWTVIASTELSLGGFIFLGDKDTKFGDPAAGGTVVFARGRISF